MNTAQKAAKVREGLEEIANDTDPKTADAIEKAVDACGDASLARLYDFIQQAIAEQRTAMTADDTFNSMTGT